MPKKTAPTVRPFRPSLDGPDCTAFGNGFFFLTKKWLVYFLALSLAMEKNGDLQKIAASNGQTSFLSDNKFWRKYEHLELFGVFFQVTGIAGCLFLLKYVWGTSATEIPLRRYCLPGHPCVVGEQGEPGWDFIPSRGWDWSNTKHDHDVSLDINTACHYIYI